MYVITRAPRSPSLRCRAGSLGGGAVRRRPRSRGTSVHARSSWASRHRMAAAARQRLKIGARFVAGKPFPAYAQRVHVKERLAAGDGFTIFDVRCMCGHGGWLPPEESQGYGAVFVRSGCFRRLNDGVETVLDPTAVYFEAPGHEQQIAHSYVGGDRCTEIELTPKLLASL